MLYAPGQMLIIQRHLKKFYKHLPSIVLVLKCSNEKLSETYTVLNMVNAEIAKRIVFCANELESYYELLDERIKEDKRFKRKN